MKKLIPIIFAVCLLVTSCGGEPTENVNYTHYNVVTSASETTASDVTSFFTVKRTDESEQFTVKIADSFGNTDSSASEKESLKNIENTSKPENSKKLENPQISSTENKNNIGNNYSKKSVLSKIKDGGNTSFSSTVYATSVNNNSKTEENTESVSAEPESTDVLEPLKDTDTAYITNTGNRYHRKGCRYLAKSCVEIIVGDAKEKGYTPCKVCKP